MAENSTTAWLNSFLMPLRPTFNEVVALSVFINILALALPIVTLQIYDRVISYNGFSTLQGLIVGMTIVVIFDFVLRQARSRILQNVALRIDVYVSRKLFNKLMSLPMQTLEDEPSAHWLSLFRDADTIRYVLSSKSATLIADIPFVLFYLIIIFVIATPIAWVFLMVLLIFMFFAWQAAAAVTAANNSEQKTTQTRSSLVLEMINARSTIKAMSLERVMSPLWEDVQAKHIEASVNQSTKIENFSNISAGLIMATFICVITVGALAIIGHELTVGTLVATCMLSSLLLGPLNQCVSNFRAYHSFRQSVERLGELFNSASERQVSTVNMDKPNGEIILENVSFAYSPELAKVINNIDISFKATGIHALVGSNGSGKSTLLRLVLGLYKPMNGRILIDGADISQFSREELSTWMGFVPQDCILFSGTVRDNIACRKLGISDDEVLRASQAAGVHHFVVDMPDGYNTEIGEAGCRLSCGERQRIAIARALVGDPPLVILDEPSSNLDYQAELELRKLLKSLGKKCTVIVVTHSPALLACCDDLVALDKGRIYVAGPSKDVLPKLFGAGADHSNSASPQLINTESQKHNKIGAMQDSSQAQTQTKATAQQKKLIAVRAVKAPPIMDTPIFARSGNEKQKEQSKLNEAQTNTPVSPDRTGGKP